VEANLKRRFVTALVAIPLLVLIVGWGRPWLFTALILSVIALALYEYCAMALPRHPGEQALGVVFGVAVALLLVIPDLAGRELWLALLLVAYFTAYLFSAGELDDRLARLGWTLLGGFYIGFLTPHWILLFRLPKGRIWVFFVLGVIMAGDSAAYFVGRRFGARKLAAEISPGKTVAGAWGYLAGSVVAGAIVGIFLLDDFAVLEVVALALLLAVLGQLGDLFESLLKRVFKVKDAGALLPGHGGLLDRIDGLIFPAVFTTAYLKVFHS
jgi:phosphatidate cytidylyltransferase